MTTTEQVQVTEITDVIGSISDGAAGGDCLSLPSFVATIGDEPKRLESDDLAEDWHTLVHGDFDGAKPARLYRRHLGTCRIKHLGSKSKLDRCDCPIWIYAVDVFGKRIRCSMRTNDLAHAISMTGPRRRGGSSKGASIDEVAIAKAIIAVASAEASGDLVYFVGSSVAVKIGISRNLPSRICNLSTASDSPIFLRLKIERGGRSLEKELHSIFDGYRRNGEWFHYNTTIREFIARCARLNLTSGGVA